jgi:hypothetical protein
VRCGAVRGGAVRGGARCRGGSVVSWSSGGGAGRCGAVRARALTVGTRASPGLRKGRPSTGWVRALASPGAVRCLPVERRCGGGAGAVRGRPSRDEGGAGIPRCGAGGGAGAVPGAVRCGHWQRRGGERGGLQSTRVRALVSSGRLFTIEVKPLACRGLRRIRSLDAGRRKGRPSRVGGGIIPW